jgi:hypothetical protein
VQGLIIGKFYAMVYCIMEKMDINSYNIIFKIIKTKITTYPKFVIMDFERAPISSIDANFPRTRLTGCFFHFSQSLWKRLQSHGMTSIYKSSEKFKLYFKMII